MKSSVRDVRRVNRQNLLELIFFNASISRWELSQQSQLSPATVTNVVTDLIKEGIVIELGSRESDGGRPRTGLALNPEHGYLVGVGVAETYIHCKLFDLTMREIGELEHILAADAFQPLQIVDEIVSDIFTLLKRADIPQEKVLGIGIGMPGIVDVRIGVSLLGSDWGWRNVPILDLLKSRLHWPVYLDNGAHMLALAEHWFGSGGKKEDIAVLLLGTGVGASMIEYGQLHRGKTNSAGEWGHTCIALDGDLCRCGSHGCLEAYIGAPGIIHRYDKLAHKMASANEMHDQVEILTHLLELASGGDPLAIKAFSETAHYLGAGIANIINLFNPQVVVVGGWVGLLLGEYLLSEVRSYIERYALQQPASIVEIHISTLGQDGVSIGGAILALEKFFNPDTSEPRITLNTPGIQGVKNKS